LLCHEIDNIERLAYKPEDRKLRKYEVTHNFATSHHRNFGSILNANYRDGGKNAYCTKVWRNIGS